jgi:hypothetical protein
MIKIDISAIKIPRGVETSPIEVARLRSLSPNQFEASFDAGFLRKAYEQAQIM